MAKQTLTPITEAQYDRAKEAGTASQLYYDAAGQPYGVSVFPSSTSPDTYQARTSGAAFSGAVSPAVAEQYYSRMDGLRGAYRGPEEEDPRVTIAELELKRKQTPERVIQEPSPVQWGGYDLSLQQLREQQRQADMMYGPKEETQKVSGGTAQFGTTTARESTTGTLAPTEETVRAVASEFRDRMDSILAKADDPTRGWGQIQEVISSATKAIQDKPEYAMIQTALERQLSPEAIEAERLKLMTSAKLALSGREQNELSSFKNAAIPAADRKALAAATREKFDTLRMQIPFQADETLKDRVSQALSTGVQYALGMMGTEADLYGRGLSLLESVGSREASLEAALAQALMGAQLTPTRGEITTQRDATETGGTDTWGTTTGTQTPLVYREAAPVTSLFPAASTTPAGYLTSHGVGLGQQNIESYPGGKKPRVGIFV